MEFCCLEMRERGLRERDWGFGAVGGGVYGEGRRGVLERFWWMRGGERESSWLWVLSGYGSYLPYTYFMDVSTVFDGLSIRIKRLHVLSLFLCHINVGYGSLQRLPSMFGA